jgi:predicted kinase
VGVCIGPQITEFKSRTGVSAPQDFFTRSRCSLPQGVSVCYKPEMRKWMRERMKRRKKAPETGKGEAKAAPLQPAYFDAEAAAPPPEMHKPEPERLDPARAEPERPEPERPEPVFSELEREQSRETPQPTLAPPSQQAAVPDPRRRRRRGRGGRGRGRGGTQLRKSTPRSEAPAQPSAEANASTMVPARGAPSASKTPAAAAPHATAPRVPKGVVVLAIGLPGSGKSSWFKRHNITPLSSDLLRALLFDDPTEQRFQDLIFSNLRSMLKARLIARRPMNYVDATNLSLQERQGWIKLAKDYGYEVHAVFFDVPVEVCLERNQRRERIVPEDVMRRMAAKLRAPTFEEGFAKMTVVRVKQKD